MSNEAALIVITAIWLIGGRGVNLCLLILMYYLVFLFVDPTKLNGYFSADFDVAVSTYALQASVDSLIITVIVYLSSIHQNMVRIYMLYGAIIATSLVLNGAMLYDQMLNLSVIYKLHAIRQEFSIPLDVLFAAIGSAAGGKAYVDRRLHPIDRTVYNRSNRDS